MLPGPVFNAELLTSSRRARYFFVRLAYGLILLFLIWVNYEDRSRREWGRMTIQEMAAFADRVFSTFALVQCIMVLALTPVLVAGSIAEEKQRKTLHYLLASRLSSGEIVLGKLGARLLHVGVFLAIGLPIMSLMSLFGGVAPGLVAAAYAGTLSTAFFLAGLSILISTIARRGRDAVSLVYILELAWLVVPPMYAGFSTLVRIPPWAAEWIGWFNDWVLATHPFAVVSRLSGRGGATDLEAIAWMIGLQVAFGSLCVALAVWRLRPAFRGQEGGVGGLAGLGGRIKRWRWRLFTRPACGDDAMLWKERYVSRTTGLVKVVGLLVALAILGCLGYGLYYFGAPAFAESYANGYGSTGSDTARTEFNVFLRVVGTVLFVLWSLSLAGAAAFGVTAEREGDTWISLVGTPLEGVEILRAKMVGALWGLRGLAAVLVLIWTTGLFAGSVHLLGYLAALIELVVFSWFAVALGTFISLRSKTTVRAQATTIGILMCLNVGYLMCCLPFEPDTVLMMLGCTPFIEAVSLMSYQDIRGLFSMNNRSFGSDGIAIVSACVIGVFAYAGGAAALTFAAFGDFDRAVDRPRRTDALGFEPPVDPLRKDVLDRLIDDEIV